MKKKTIIFLGSSVTYGEDNWSMCEYISETTSEYDVVKWAVSGTTLSDINEESYVCRFNAEADTQTSCDCFICQLSTNDAARNLPLGTISESVNKEDFDTQTIVGAIEYIVAKAKETWQCPVMFYTETYMQSENYQKMVNALIELSKKWSFAIINLWDDPEMREIDPELYKKYMRDPVHPRKIGYTEWWGPKFIEAINGVFKDR